MIAKLRRSTSADLRMVAGWIHDADDLCLWAGPAARFPHDHRSLAEDIDFDRRDTQSMIDQRGHILGMGQLDARPGHTVHLARVIVSPRRRGEGLGSVLCRLLLERGVARFDARRFTLNVHRRNSRAIRVYEGMGFVASALASPASDVLAMQLDLSPRSAAGPTP
jgi:RimJ/RimL family protein N-acetyltransferase